MFQVKQNLKKRKNLIQPAILKISILYLAETQRSIGMLYYIYSHMIDTLNLRTKVCYENDIDYSTVQLMPCFKPKEA